MLEVFVVCAAIFVGLVAGWWLRGNDLRHIRVRMQSDDAARTREVLGHLRDLTRDVATDVDKHKALMGRISDELQTSGTQQPTAVLRAVDKLIQFNERMQQQLVSAEKKLEDQAQQIVTHSVEALTDALTGLANRRAFDRELNRIYREAMDSHTTSVVMMMDVDHFKDLNDTYGHQAGDQVLSSMAQRLREAIPPEHLVARYGGEEFAVIFSPANIEEIADVAEQARVAMGSATFDFDGLQLHVTVSAGLAEVVPGETAASLLGRADDALYVSKEVGRNSAHFHDGSSAIRLGCCEQTLKQASAPKSDRPAYDIGISSPEAFSNDLRRRLDESRKTGTPLCLIFVQVDELEFLRDRHGEENCDAMLRALTLVLKATMREIDHAARFQEQSLCLLLPGANLTGAVGVAERLRAATAQCELPSRHEQQSFTVSIGVGEALEDEDEHGLIERVRDSLKVARMHGQDCTYVHDGRDFHLVGVGSVSVTS